MLLILVVYKCYTRKVILNTMSPRRKILPIRLFIGFFIRDDPCLCLYCCVNLLRLGASGAFHRSRWRKYDHSNFRQRQRPDCTRVSVCEKKIKIFILYLSAFFSKTLRLLLLFTFKTNADQEHNQRCCYVRGLGRDSRSKLIRGQSVVCSFMTGA